VPWLPPYFPSSLHDLSHSQRSCKMTCINSDAHLSLLVYRTSRRCVPWLTPYCTRLPHSLCKMTITLDMFHDSHNLWQNLTHSRVGGSDLVAWCVSRFYFTMWHDSIAMWHDSITMLHDSITLWRDSITKRHDSITKRYVSVTIWHDSNTMWHDSITMWHDSITTWHDSIIMWHDSITMWHDSITVWHDSITMWQTHTLVTSSAQVSGASHVTSCVSEVTWRRIVCESDVSRDVTCDVTSYCVCA